MTNQKRIHIGEIATVHGVRGLVKVRCFGDDIETLEKFGPLFIAETGDKTVTLKLKHQAGGAWIAEVDGITDRNIAETLRGTQLWLDRDALPELDDAYYYEDLVGLDVRDHAGQSIGKILAIQNFGASDLVEIQPVTGKSYFLPFTDDYVPNVDIDGGFIIVEIPAGWLDE